MTKDLINALQIAIKEQGKEIELIKKDLIKLESRLFNNEEDLKINRTKIYKCIKCGLEILGGNICSSCAFKKIMGKNKNVK